jgi:muconolactone delta-isomerase
MEYLVTMTTHVPGGTSEAAVDEMRRREDVRSRELSVEGHLLRLWRPPLKPGEWRTLGLFAATDPDELEKTLASMPLRIWRTDEVTPLFPHPNDPGVTGRPVPNGWAEYLTTFRISAPEGTPAEVVDDAEVAEAARARTMAEQGHLLRLWRLDGSKAMGIWRAASATEMEAIVNSLPHSAWMTVETTPLSLHPSDPLSRVDR